MQLEPIRLGNGHPSNWRRSVRTAVATALLAFQCTTVPAAADSLSDRFKYEFADTPAHTDAAAAAAAEPDATASAGPPAAAAAPVPQPAAATKPKLKRPHHAQSAAAKTDSKMSLLPGDPSADRPSPALSAIKPAGTIPTDNNLHISWNPADLTWDGMFLSNGAAKPLAVTGITFNNNKSCALRPYRLSEIRKSIELPQAVKVWGESAINLFGLPQLQPDAVLIPDLSRGFQAAGVRPDALIVKPGGRIPIYNGTKCDSVTEALVETDKGDVPIKFKAPYTGH